MLVKQCEDPSANTLLPILQSKFGSAESELFAYRHRMKPRTTVEIELKVTQSALDVHMGCTPFVKD